MYRPEVVSLVWGSLRLACMHAQHVCTHVHTCTHETHTHTRYACTQQWGGNTGEWRYGAWPHMHVQPHIDHRYTHTHTHMHVQPHIDHRYTHTHTHTHTNTPHTPHTRKTYQHTHVHTHTHTEGANAHGMYAHSNGVVIQVGGGTVLGHFTHTHMHRP